METMEDVGGDYEIDCHEPGDQEPLAEKASSEHESDEPEEEEEEEEEEDEEDIDPGVHIQGVCHVDAQYCGRQENVRRGNWFINLQGTLAMMGVVFMASALQSFPQDLLRHGPAYLVVYGAVVLMVGFPLLYIEMSMGQFTSSGVLTCWPLPIFKGVGFGMLWHHVVVAISFNSVGAWALYYLYTTIVACANDTDLPWFCRDQFMALAPECNNNTEQWWNPDLTQNLVIEDDCKANIPDGGICWSNDVDSDNNPTRIPVSVYDMDVAVRNLVNGTKFDTAVDMKYFLSVKTLSQVFYQCHVVGNVQNSTDITFLPATSVSYLVSWILITLTAILGPKSIGPIINLTVPTALVFMIMLAVKVFEIPGNMEFMTDFWSGFSLDQLADPDLWVLPVKTVISTLFVCCGIHLTFASYNRFHNNFVRDATIVCLFNIIVSLLGAIVVVGLARPYLVDNNLPDTVDSLLDIISGPTFEVMPKLLDYVSSTKLYNGLFYGMVFLMAFHPLVGFLEMAVAAFVDQVPSVRKLRFLVTMIFGIVFFLAGLPLCTTDATGWANLLLHNWNLYQIYAIILLFVLCYLIYGISKYFWYRHDVAAMAQWDCCCLPSILIWMCVTGIGIVLIVLIILGILGYNITDVFLPFKAPLTNPGYLSWMTPEFVLCVRFSLLAIIGLAMIIHIIVALIQKRSVVGFTDLFTEAWLPAISHHAAIVQHYRHTNRYSTQNYGTLDSEHTVLDPENVPLKESLMLTPPSPEKMPLADDAEDAPLKDAMTPTSEIGPEAV